MGVRYIKQLILFLILSFLSIAAFAVSFPLPSFGNSLIGKVRVVQVPQGSDIIDLGQKYSIGLLEFMESNPTLNLNSLWAGEKILVPTRFILPKTPRHGIVINVAELRLYYYDVGKVYTFPIGIGRPHSPTPLVLTSVIEKRENPIWIPTEDTRAEAREMGIHLPREILPGPQNPLGKYALRLGLHTYLIHGTNKPAGVGIRSSGGCIRMYPKDIKKLYSLVRVGTPVDIVDQAIKVGWKGNILYLEAHVPVDHKRSLAEDRLQPLVDVITVEVNRWHAKIDWKRAMLIAEQQTGIPMPIGRREFNSQDKNL